MSRSRAAAARLVVLALVVSPLAGCNDYLDRRMSVSEVSGDAVRTNIVTHTIDPWPPGSHRRHVTLDGERAVANVAIPKEPPAAPARRTATTGVGN